MRTNILQYLEETASAAPDKTSFSDGTDCLTFSGLLRAARGAGSALLRRGLERGTAVLILMDKHPDTVAAFLAVLYAGGFYVPLDSDMPPVRAEMIAETVSPRFIIADRKNAPRAAALGCELLLFDEIREEPADDARLFEVRRNQTDTDIIYVVFTSGSTGVPKGVAACHRSVIDYTESLCEALGFDGDTVFGNQTPLYFDAPLKEIIPTLKFGATTYFIPKKLFMFPVKLVEYLNGHKINTICWVVSALTVISSLGTFETIKPAHLRTVAFGSEVFPPKQFNIWRSALPDTVFFNLYGPTEATGMSTFHRVDEQVPEGGVIPIGKPFCNTRIMLIGEGGREIKPGEDAVGEIYIGGTCVTLGYYNNPEKTAEAFVQNPTIRAYRDIVYRTGDLARRNGRGELIFVCRRDYQIKHMGHRIELGEIEAAADMHGGVTRACCIYDNENKKILLYYTGGAEEGAIAAHLRSHLPRYMLPALCRRLDMLPLTPNGKLDRRALREIWEVLK